MIPQKNTSVSFRYSICIILFLLLPQSHAFALDYPRLSPEEVAERADLVIYGEYDFEGGRLNDEGDGWWSYIFHVEKVFKGEASERMVVGLLGYDAHLIKRAAQEDGTKFLLFLERSPDTEFPVPVNFTDGMVSMTHDDQFPPNMVEEQQAFYSEFITHHEAREPEAITHPLTYGVVVLAVIALALGLFYYLRFLSRKRAQL